MARPCSVCSDSEKKANVERRLAQDMSFTDIAAVLGMSRNTIARHAKHVGSPAHRSGTVPYRGNLLQDVVNDAGSRLEAGELRASLRDGINAQKEINREHNRSVDRDLMLKIGLMLTAPRPALLSPEVEALEGEYRLLLSGDERDQAEGARLLSARDDLQERARQMHDVRRDRR